jgi:hypothetical protein
MRSITALLMLCFFLRTCFLPVLASENTLNVGYDAVDWPKESSIEK